MKTKIIQIVTGSYHDVNWHIDHVLYALTDNGDVYRFSGGAWIKCNGIVNTEKKVSAMHGGLVI